MWGRERQSLLLFGAAVAIGLLFVARPSLTGYQHPSAARWPVVGIGAASGAVIVLLVLVGMVPRGSGPGYAILIGAAWPLALGAVVLPVSSATPGSALHAMALRLQWLVPGALTVVGASTSIAFCAHWHGTFSETPMSNQLDHLANHKGSLALVACGFALSLAHLGRVAWGLRLRASSRDLGLGLDEHRAETSGGGYRSSSVTVATSARGMRELAINAGAAIIALSICSMAMLPLVLSQYPTCECSGDILEGPLCLGNGWIRPTCKTVHPLEAAGPCPKNQVSSIGLRGRSICCPFGAICD